MVEEHGIKAKIEFITTNLVDTLVHYRIPMEDVISKGPKEWYP